MSQTILSSSQSNKGSLVSIDDVGGVLFKEIPPTVGSFSYTSPKKKPSNLLRSDVSSKVGGEMRVSGPSLLTKDDVTRNLHINQILANISRATRNGDVALVKVLNNSLKILKNQNVNSFPEKKAVSDTASISNKMTPSISVEENNVSPIIDTKVKKLRPTKRLSWRHHTGIITGKKAVRIGKVRSELFSNLDKTSNKTKNLVLRKRKFKPERGGMASDMAIPTSQETSPIKINTPKEEVPILMDRITESTTPHTSPDLHVVEKTIPIEKRRGSPDTTNDRLDMASKVLGAIMKNVNSGNDMIARLMSPFGFSTQSASMKVTSHPENLPTRQSWKKFLDSGDISQFVDDLTQMSEEDLITKYISSYVNPTNPSLWSSVSSFNAYELFNSPSAVYGLTGEQRTEVSLLLKNLGIIDQTVDKNLMQKKYEVTPSYLTDYKDYFAKYPKTTVHVYYEEVRGRIAQADKERNN